MRVFLPWVLTAMGCSTAFAGTVGPQADPLAQDRLVDLIESGRDGVLPSTRQLTDALLAEGAEAAQRWFHELYLRRPERVGVHPEEVIRVLSAPTLHGLEGVTRGVPAEIRERLDDPGLSVSARLDAARVGLEILARQGSGADLTLACDLATPGEGVEQEPYRPLGESLKRAVTQILLEDVSGFGEVEALFRESHPWVQGFLLRGIAGTRSFAALRKLPLFMGKVEGLDAFILTQTGNVAQYVNTPLDDATLLRIRAFLGSSSSTERGQAAYALGHLDDYDCLEDLITLLTDETDVVRQSAHWSLREITAMTIQPEPRRWRLWFDSETQWWTDEAPRLLMTIQQGELPEVIAAINVCGGKRLFRRQLSRELVPMLQSPEVSVVRMTCSSLQSLRATEAVPDLVELLTHASSPVREQAWLGLRELTGIRDLPAEVGAWREVLQLGPPTAR